MSLFSFTVFRLWMMLSIFLCLTIWTFFFLTAHSYPCGLFVLYWFVRALGVVKKLVLCQVCGKYFYSNCLFLFLWGFFFHFLPSSFIFFFLIASGFCFLLRKLSMSRLFKSIAIFSSNTALISVCTLKSFLSSPIPVWIALYFNI